VPKNKHNIIKDQKKKEKRKKRKRKREKEITNLDGAIEFPDLSFLFHQLGWLAANGSLFIGRDALKLNKRMNKH